MHHRTVARLGLALALSGCSNATTVDLQLQNRHVDPDPSVFLTLLDADATGRLKAAADGELKLSIPVPAAGNANRYDGLLYQADVPVARFSLPASGNSLDVHFSHLASADYYLELRAFDSGGDPLELQAPARDRLGPFHLQDAPSIRRLEVPVAPVPGDAKPHTNLPVSVHRSTPAHEELVQSLAPISQQAFQDDEEAMTLTPAGLQQTASSHYIALAVGDEGHELTWLGPVQFSLSQDDPRNPGSYTLFARLFNHTRAFYFNQAQHLVAVGEFKQDPQIGLIRMVDPESVPDETYYGPLHPDGTDARHHYYVDAHRRLYNLYAGPQADDGLLGLDFLDPNLGLVVIQQVR